MTNTNYRILVEKEGYFIFGIKKNINKGYKHNGANQNCFASLSVTINYMEKNKICGIIVSDSGLMVYAKKYDNRKGIKL